MKQLSLALNILLLVLVAVLFYLHFNAQKKQVAVTPSKAAPTPAVNQPQIAYFDLDTLQAKYQYFKDAEAQLKSSQQSMTAELGGLEREYQKKMGEWQQKGPTMSQAEADAAQREKARMEQKYQTRRQVLEEALAKKSMEINKDIKLKIEGFLKEYNKDNRYAYILAYMPELIYYRDTTNNITDDLLKGLNDSYKKAGTSD
jgi:outer membrane protein